MSSPEREQVFQAALARIDEENANDPRGIELPYAERLSAWVERLAPDASVELRLAARAQHLCRWMIPRAEFPMNRTGYLQWREALKKFHAERAGAILRAVGYEEAVTHRVQHLIMKKLFPNDPESRVLEDALCLLFLEIQFREFSQRTDEQKMIGILQKTWRKMTPTAREIARQLPIEPPGRALFEKAVDQAAV